MDIIWQAENTVLYPIPNRHALIVVRAKSWPLVLLAYSAANDFMPEAGTRTSPLFAAPAGSPLPISHPLSSICRASRAIRRLCHPEPRSILETRYFCLSPSRLCPSRCPRCCAHPAEGETGTSCPPQLQRSAVRLSSVNLPVPFFGAFPPLLNRFSSHCLLCACHPARNDFPSTCGGLFLARVVDYPSALHCLPQASLVTSAALSLSTTLSSLSLIYLVFDHHND